MSNGLAGLPGEVPDELRDAVLAGDPAAIYLVGDRQSDGAAAQAWFIRAAELGLPVAMLRLALVAANHADFDAALHWLSRVPERVPDDVPGPRWIVWMTKFFEQQGRSYGDDGWETSPAFFLVCPDVEGACRAMYHAAQRFGTVTESGRESEPWELDEEYTPNWISDVYRAPASAIVLTDTKGELPKPMGERMLRIVVEEVFRAKLRAVLIAPPPNVNLDEYETWTPEPTSAPAPTGPQAWFMTRCITRTTIDGRRYFDSDYLAADGGWVRARAQAVRRVTPTVSEEDVDLCRQLRTQPRPGNAGQPTWVLLPLEDRERPGSMPPLELRGDD